LIKGACPKGAQPERIRSNTKTYKILRTRPPNIKKSHDKKQAPEERLKADQVLHMEFEATKPFLKPWVTHQELANFFSTNFGP
jgi:hypothetical protein